MIHKTGDLFTTGLVAIGHGVNLRGVMGAGVARLVREKYPDAEEKYVEACAANALHPGAVQVLELWDTCIIVNMATQIAPGPHAKIDLIDLAARNVVMELTWRYGLLKLAIPRIGCGIGGLDWDKVEPVFQAAEALVPGFEFEVWTP